jgi:hypothetical protein
MILVYLRKVALLFCLVLLSSHLQSQNFQELYQGFEGNANDTWNVTPNPAAYSNAEDEDFWTASTATAEISPAVGAQFWYMQDLDNPNGGFNGFHTLDFEAIDVSSFPFNTISFKYYTIGYEDADSIGYTITIDGVEGDFVALDRNTQAWETVFINLPDGVNTVGFQLMAKQNGGSDFAGFDDVFITSSDIDILPPTVLGGELIDENTVRIIYNEPMNEASVTTPANYTVAATIDNITYIEPGDGTSYVDISFAAPFVDGQQYLLSVGLVFDVSGNFFLDGFTYTFIYNNSTPNLVITEIMYNPPGSDDVEFVEVYNAGDETAAIGGLTFTVANDFTFPAVDLAPGEVILLAQFEADAEDFYGMDFYDWGTGALSNGGDNLTISNYTGQIIDEVSYDDADPWPVAADGDGPSLELIAPSLDNALASSWRATTTQFGDTEFFATPGTISDDLTPVVTFEEGVIALDEGSGPLSLRLVINNSNMSAAEVSVNIVGASTAVEGVDYTITSAPTVTFPAGTSDSQPFDIELLDNDATGGRYLILELTNPVNANLGTNDQLIVLIKDNDLSTPEAPANPSVVLNHLTSYQVGNVAEIVAYDEVSNRLYVANSGDNRLEIVDLADPNTPGPVNSLDLNVYNGEINSVAVSNEIVALALAGNSAGEVGKVVFLDTDGFYLDSVQVGFLPDMLIFTPDGTKVLTANEGEPDDDYTIDPEGSVSIIDLATNGLGFLSQADVTNVSFTAFNSEQATLEAAGVRIFGPGATVAQDLEPEFIAISEDGNTAYVSCQENNALIIVDIATGTATSVLPLGYKDWTTAGNVLDASNESPDIFFANWPILGMYQPDAITTFTVGGQEYIISANEGDARDYDGFSEEFRVGDSEIVLDPTAYPDADYLKEDVLLGRLRITSATGDTDNDGDIDQLYAYGARSFTIWNATTGAVVYDSGSEMEAITAADPVYGALFNSDDEENDFKDRSDDKGPEPEAVTVAEVNGIPYAFIGMERIGGIMVYDLSDPTAPQFIQYINTRTVDMDGGDLSPEDVIFISSDESATGQNLLVASYEVSGTIGVFEVQSTSTVSFADANAIVEEGTGLTSFPLIVESTGGLDGTAVIDIISASTAVDGEDYIIASTTINFNANDPADQDFKIDILENTKLGGRYLILEINEEQSTVNIGEESRFILLIQDNDDEAPVADANPSLQMNHLGSFDLGGDNVAEIVAYDGESQRLFVTNSEANSLEVLDYSDPANLTTVNSVNLSVFGGGVNSVAVANGIVAVAVEGVDVDDNGTIVFLNTDGIFQNSVEAGVLPDMVTFTPDGTKVLTANEGEPSDDYLTDPEGSVTIVDLSGGVGTATANTIGFTAFNGDQAALIEQGVRIFGPGATVAQDLEPEYIAVSDDGTTAYVMCQENNALVLVNIGTETVDAILPIGFKDWTEEGVTFDASNRTDDIFFANWPVNGMYQPDAIDYFNVGGAGYLITANEGDARDYDDFSEEFRVGDDEIPLDPTAFPDAEYLKDDALLGRLRITSANGDTDGDGDYDELYAYGARSFTIWDATTGALVYDSGNDLEQITAADPVFGALFNSDDEENAFKNRSDDKGPEPEAVITGIVNGRPYAFIGLERIGGVMAYDVSDPAAPVFIQYINTRTVETEGGDLSPEGLAFIPAEDSPTGKALLSVAYEVSGTVGMFEIESTSTVSFADANAIVEEGTGLIAYPLIVESTGGLNGTAVIDIISASTAIDGEDYTIASTTIDFDANDPADKLIELDILDNTDLGGRYLILEINKAESTVGIGEEGRFILLIQDNDDEAPVADADAYVQLNHLGSFDLGGDNVAEILAHDGATQRLFVTNSETNALEILSYADPAAIAPISTVDLSAYGGGVNSVAVANGIVAVAVEGENVDDNGTVVFFDTDGTFQNSVETGVLPDMVTFTPDGTKVLTANEGEPSDDYTIDPEGSITIIDIAAGVAAATANTIGFEDFNSQQATLVEQGLRIFGPGATLAQDMEPEYIAISEDGAFAYVGCQENNATVVVDIEAQAIVTIIPLGSKDWSLAGNTFDASNRIDDIFFANWPVSSFYQPDAVDFFVTGGAGYLITANEGDARDYDEYSEEARIGDDEIVLDPTAFPDAEYLKDNALLGRLKMTTANGDTDGDGDFDEVYAYGGRSFTIWNATTGELVYDSGNDLEQITAADPVYGPLFNSDDEENAFKNRSDDKGPEPEAVLTTEIDGRQFAFIGLERTGGVMVYNVTNPEAPVFLQYINTRTVDTEGGDLSPEGLNFIPVEDSPSGKPLLTVAYEVSGTIGVFELDLNCPIISIPDEVTVCEGDVALLEVTGQYADIAWSTGEEGPSIIVEEAGEITVMATTAGGCMASDTVMVDFVPSPIVTILSDGLPCDGESVTLSTTDTFVTYEWSTGDTTETIEISTSGTYGITVTDQNGCEGSQEGTITFLDSPVFDFPADTVICVFDVLVYTPQEGDILIIDDTQVDNFSTEGLEVGTYSVAATLIGPEGCQRDVEFNFTIDVCGSTNEKLVAEQIKLFPNPTSGLTNVRLSQLQARRYELEVLNTTGQLIERHAINNTGTTFKQELDLTAMPSGIYFIRLSNDKGTKVNRLIVE